MVVWLSSRDLRRKYIYAIALDACEAVNGVSYILVGIGRGLALVGDYLTEPITVRQCFLEASLLVGGLSTMGPAGDVIISSQHCPIISSTAPWYASFHYIFIVSAYIVAFVSVFVVWRISKRYSVGRKSRDNRLSAILITAGSSIILIGSKSAVMLSTLWKFYRFNNFIVTLTYSMPGFLSIAGTVINFVFRPDYRKQFFSMVHIRDPFMQASISNAQTMSVKARMSVAAHAKF
ncbi:hypothetical protein Y032_0005g2281 [Ancylostoma ceylanicum]|uniref:Uncharacterized protein n=1 Tax=Ancylostoma ceylanicum TaxID=53326 RepID=A0A016VRZ1_9BILA|nr:hypothetical protein Y032_0005g2281 [Ancylostoma ceylanicum]